MVLNVFAKVPITTLTIDYRFEHGYLRVYRQSRSAAFLQLIEQLAIWRKLSMLMAMYDYLDKNPFHQFEPLKIYYYRHTLYELKCLISKLQVGLSPHIALSIFYRKISPALEGFALAYKSFGHTIFEKAGFRYVSLAHTTNYQAVQIGQGKNELVLVEEEYNIYGFINQDGEIEFGDIEKPLDLKHCSICQIAKLDLANNLFCRHRYCVHCLNFYFKQHQSITCPKIGCNAKIIRRLIQIKNQKQESRPNSAERERKRPKKQSEVIQEEPKVNTLLLDPNWPPIFKGNHIPSYVESQFIQIRKIIEYKCEEKLRSPREVDKNTNYCGQCLMILWDIKQKGSCGRHPLCLPCSLNPATQCLLC